MAERNSSTPIALCVTNTTTEKGALITAAPGTMLLDTSPVAKRERKSATPVGRDSTALNRSASLDVTNNMAFVKNLESANAV